MGYRIPVWVFEQLYKQACQSVPMVQNLGGNLLLSLQTCYPGLFDEAELEIGPLKRLDRATDKIIGDYKGDHTQIYDLARGRIIVDTVEQIEALRKYLDDNKEVLGIEKWKDRFAEPSDTGFRDINMNIRLPNGHVIEFRVEHRAMLNVAKLTHELYEKIQKINRAPVKEDRDFTAEEVREETHLFDAIRDIHSHPAQKAALNRLLNDRGRERLKIHDKERVTSRLSHQEMAEKIARLTEKFAKKKQSSPEEPDISMSEALARLFNFHHQSKSEDKGGSAAGQATPQTQKSIKPAWKKGI